MSLFGVVPETMTMEHTHTIDKNSVVQAAAAAGLTLAAVAGLYKVLNRKVVDPMIAASEQPPVIQDSPLELKTASARILQKLAETTVTDIPGVGQYEETVSMSVDPVAAMRVSSIPAFLGNLMASSRSGKTSLLKALLASSAGAVMGSSAMEATKNLGIHYGATGELGTLAAAILAAGGTGYGARRIMDLGSVAPSNEYDRYDKYTR